MKKKHDNNAGMINLLITHKNNYNKKKTLLSEGLIFVIKFYLKLETYYPNQATLLNITAATALEAVAATASSADTTSVLSTVTPA